MSTRVLCVGTAKASITPARGSNMAGFGRRKPAEGVADELFTKALVFDDGHTTAALVSADLQHYGSSFVDDVLARTVALTGLPRTCVMLHCTHTHSGPAMDTDAGADFTYLAKVAEQMASVVREAWRAKQPARIGFGSGGAPISVNRWIQDGNVVRWGPNSNGPKDDSVNVAWFDNETGRPFAFLVNYAAHPTVLGGGNLYFSADYPGAVQRAVEGRHTNAIAVFVTGAAGDIKIAHLTEDGRRFRYGTHENGGVEAAHRYGQIVGTEALRIVENGQAASACGPVRVAYRVLELPLCDPPSSEALRQEIAERNKRLAELHAADHPEAAVTEERLRAWAQKTLDEIKHGNIARVHPVEIQVIRLGDALALVGVAGEPFVELGLRIKAEARSAGHPPILFLGFTNAYAGYIPSARACRDGWCVSDDSHKYEGTPAPYSEAAENILCKTVQEMLTEVGE